MAYIETAEKPDKPRRLSGTYWRDDEGDIYLLSGDYREDIWQNFRLMIRLRDGSRLSLPPRGEPGYTRFHGVITISTEE